MVWETWNGRIVFHVDMNSFYASVEKVHDPSLVGKPIAIAGNPRERRGIIVTASYEARSFGVKTTMPVWEAKRKCPHLIILPPDFDKYRAASAEMFQLLNEYSEIVQPVSIDEGYMDMTDTFKKGKTIHIADELQNRLKRELGLPCSVGIAPNKFLAKMASDMKKPMGITILRKRDIKSKLWPLSLEDMHGIGKKTSAKLQEWNIYTIGELAEYSQDALGARFGVKGKKLWERANGIDYREVDPEAAKEIKSVGNSTTLAQDIEDKQTLLQVIRQLSKKVEKRMRRKEVCSANIQLMIRYRNRKTVTRSKKLSSPLFSAEEIEIQAAELLKRHWNGDPVRLLGITGLDVVPISEAYKQLDLFSYKKDVRENELAQTISKLTKRYGEGIITKGYIR